MSKLVHSRRMPSTSVNEQKTRFISSNHLPSSSLYSTRLLRLSICPLHRVCLSDTLFYTHFPSGYDIPKQRPHPHALMDFLVQLASLIWIRRTASVA